MPTVPRYDGPQVGVQGLPGVLVQTPDARPVQGAQPVQARGRLTVPVIDPVQSNLPSVAPVQPGGLQAAPTVDQGMMLSAAGRAVQQASAAALDIMTYRAEQANQLRVTDALNRVKEAELRLTYDPQAGFMAARGAAAMQRESGKPLADEYRDSLQDQIKQIRAGLGNDQQRALFDQHAPAIVSSLYGRAMAHEADQARDYGLSVSAGVQATAQREIGLRYMDPAAVNGAVERIQAETAREAQLTGRSAEWVQAQTQARTSAAHRIAIGQALEDRRPDYAAAYLERYKGQMTADDVLAVRGAIDREGAIVTGMGAAADIWGRNRPMTPFDALHAAMIGQESGGRQFGPDGQVLTSPAGALGVGQFMPDTARMVAQQHGIPFDLDRLKTDDAYNRQLSRLHLQDLLTQFGGDPQKALAAYNAGAGAVTAAEKAGGADWLSHMPAETRDYVPAIMGRYQRMNTGGQRPTLADLDQQARDNPALAANPAALQHAQQDLAQRAQLDAQAIKQRQAEGYAAALDALRQNGGDWNTLPPSIREAVPADKVDEAMRYATVIRTGQPVQTDMALYGGLVRDPAQMARMTDADFAALSARIAGDDLKHLAALRAKAANPDTPESRDPGNLDHAAVKSVLDTRLKMLGIDPTPKDGTPDAARVGAIWQHVNRSLLDLQRGASRRFNEAEITQHIDVMIAQTALSRNAQWWKPASMEGTILAPMLTMRAGDIPGADRDQIIAAYEKAGISSPTDAQVLAAYWRAQVP